MPQKIAEFNAPLDQASPTGAGAEAMFRAGRLIEYNSRTAGQDVTQLGGAIGNAINTHLAQEDILTGGVKVNQAIIANQAAMDKGAQSGEDLSDPAVIGKYGEQRDTVLDQIAESARTPESAMRLGEIVNNAKLHGAELQHATMNTFAREKTTSLVKQNVDTLGVMVAQNPASLPYAYQQIDGLITHAKSNPGLDAASIAGIDALGDTAKKSVTKAMFDKMVFDNPAMAEKFAANPPAWAAAYVPDGGGLMAQQAGRARRMEAMQGRSLQLQEQRQAYEHNSDVTAKAIHDATTPDELKAATDAATKVALAPGAPASAFDEVTARIQRRTMELNTGKPVLDNPSVRGQFESTVGTPGFNPIAARQARDAGTLSQTTFDRMMADNANILHDPSMVAQTSQANAMIDAYQTAYDASVPGIQYLTKPTGDVAFSLFQARVRPLVNAAILAGKPLSAQDIAGYVNVADDKATAAQYIKGAAPPVVPVGQTPPSAAPGANHLPAGTKSFQDWLASANTTGMSQVDKVKMYQAYQQMMRNQGSQ